MRTGKLKPVTLAAAKVNTITTAIITGMRVAFFVTLLPLGIVIVFGLKIRS
jgi:hypothetical protein